LGKLLPSLQVLQDEGSLCRPLSAAIHELGYLADFDFDAMSGELMVTMDLEV
jgi:hypothetical protein